MGWLGAVATHGISEIYSFKGATGSGSNNFFPRPTGERATYAVVLDEQTDSIAIQRYTEWDYAAGAVTRSVVEGYLNAPAMVVAFEGAGSGSGKRAEGPRSVLGAHRRKRHWH